MILGTGIPGIQVIGIIQLHIATIQVTGIQIIITGYYDPYPYYDNGYYSSTYKYRTNDGYKIRNNSGGRNSGGRNTSGDRNLYTSSDGIHH